MVWVMNDMYMFSICSIHGCDGTCVAAAVRAFFLRIAILCVREHAFSLCSDSPAHFDAAAPEKMRAQKNCSDSS
jgi:hypothetical protein